jgi:hypothetical protein
VYRRPGVKRPARTSAPNAAASRGRGAAAHEGHQPRTAFARRCTWPRAACDLDEIAGRAEMRDRIASGFETTQREASRADEETSNAITSGLLRDGFDQCDACVNSLAIEQTTMDSVRASGKRRPPLFQGTRGKRTARDPGRMARRGTRRSPPGGAAGRGIGHRDTFCGNQRPACPRGHSEVRVPSCCRPDSRLPISHTQ